MKFQEYFDRIFIVNLPERTDRRAEMRAELRGIGVALEEGRTEFFPAVKVRDAAGFLNAGYHGCFRSHLEVFKKAIAANASNVLILEDDASFAPRLLRDGESLVGQLSQLDWGTGSRSPRIALLSSNAIPKA